jgi:carboxyl-terminal processing protease
MRTLALLLLILAGPAFAQAPPEPELVPEPASELSPLDPEAAETPPTAIPLDEIQRYVSVYRAIQEAYVEPMTDQALMKAALRGLLGDLDPHSAYLEQEEAQALQEQSEGEYSGVGVEIEQRSDRSMMVVAPIDGTPAQRAGLRAGDLIIAVDGKPLAGDGADAASQELRGPPGTVVTLTVLRAGDPVPREMPITREVIRITSVASRLLEPGYGYVRISTFQADTGPELLRQLEALKETSGGALSGLVLDLRSNPGGLLNAAVEAADALLDSGLIVTTKGRLVYSNASFHAKPGDALDGASVIVLVDAGTASAAEVLAGALSDHERALVMGSRTFGKGSVQTVVPLENGDSVKLTTARYYTPSGRSIQARGIQPDVLLRGEATRGLREQDLPGHLRGDEEVGDGYARGEVIEGDEAISQALARLKSDGAASARVPAAG